MQPGLAATPGTSQAVQRYHRVFAPVLCDADQAADTALWLAASPTTAAVRGGFFFDRGPCPSHLVSWTRCDEAEVDRLWATCASLCGLDADGAV